MLHHRCKIASTFVGQLRRSRIDLDDADDAKEEEDHPDDLIALEDIV